APSQSVVAAGYPVATVRPALSPADPGVTGDASVNVAELLLVLRTSLYPSQREWAADRLTACDWHANPQLVEDLAGAARNDAAPLVRVGCLRAIAKLHCTGPAALEAAFNLRNDPDARVRHEADQTLAALQMALPGRAVD